MATSKKKQWDPAKKDGVNSPKKALKGEVGDLRMDRAKLGRTAHNPQGEVGAKPQTPDQTFYKSAQNQTKAAKKKVKK